MLLRIIIISVSITRVDLNHPTCYQVKHFSGTKPKKKISNSVQTASSRLKETRFSKLIEIQRQGLVKCIYTTNHGNAFTKRMELCTCRRHGALVTDFRLSLFVFSSESLLLSEYQIGKFLESVTRLTVTV